MSNQRKKNTLEQRLKHKRIEMEQCVHLFVKQEEGYWTGGYHSSDYEYTPCLITCVKCGLNNNHLNMDIILRNKYINILRQFDPTEYYMLGLNDDIFKKQFGNNQGLESERKITFLSDEVLSAINPMELYQQAKEINPDADNEELFQIMKKLHDEKEKVKKKTL